MSLKWSEAIVVGRRVWDEGLFTLTLDAPGVPQFEAGQFLQLGLRDGEHHALVQEIIALRYGPGIASWRETLGAKLNTKQRALLAVALSFHTWRTLTVEAGQKQADAVTTMVIAIAP